MPGGMSKDDRALIQGNLTQLITKTQWNTTLEVKLVEDKVFSTGLLEAITATQGEERKKQLYVSVQKRGPTAFKKLVSILVDSGNHEAANILDKAVMVPPPAEGAAAAAVPEPRDRKVWNEPTYDIPQKEAFPEHYDKPELHDDRTPINVEVKKATQYRGPPALRAYQMTSKPRGLALIIDNEEFDNDIMLKRDGSSYDSNNLDILLEKLDFKVTLRRNLNYGEMNEAISSFSQRPEHAHSDMVVVAIMSHGDQGLVYSKDGRHLPVEGIMARFNNDGCPALRGKPKFFILQACRGDEADYGHVPRLDFSEDPPTAIDAVGVPSERMRRMSLTQKQPSWEDFLIAYATVPGYVANRNRYRGTWFIECLCKVFMERACELDIREMLDEVSHRIKFYESEYGTKQSCSYEVRHFYKKLYFNPGLYGDLQPMSDGAAAGAASSLA